MMNKLLFAIGLATLPLLAHADSYQIDPAHTFPNFMVNHGGYSNMYGRFGKTSGTIEMDKTAGTGAVNLVIEVASINTGFGKRDDHLRSPDFFNAAEFPELTFKSTKVNYKGDGAEVTGALTMVGVTKSVTLSTSKINCRPHFRSKKMVCGFNAEGMIKRSDFGIKYGLPGIGDDIKLMIEVEAVKI